MKYIPDLQHQSMDVVFDETGVYLREETHITKLCGVTNIPSMYKIVKDIHTFISDPVISISGEAGDLTYRVDYLASNQCHFNINYRGDSMVAMAIPVGKFEPFVDDLLGLCKRHHPSEHIPLPL